MNVQNVINDVRAEQHQLRIRVHENFDNIDKEKRNRFYDEVVLLANGIREDMYDKIDTLESAVPETMTFEAAIPMMDQLENEITGVLSDYKSALDNLLEQEIGPRLEELISDRKVAIRRYIMKEEKNRFWKGYREFFIPPKPVSVKELLFSQSRRVH